jgi:NAD(P)-dependent dehydrogenase (short-subunit alcohol dehydrogenase family)
MTGALPNHPGRDAVVSLRRRSIDTPLGRAGTPDEIAKAVVFLALDDSSYVTAIELFADGGMAKS